MKTVLLVCEAGISSDFLAKSAKIFVEGYQAPINYITTDFAEANTYLDNDIDLILVAPQAQYHDEMEELSKSGIPVSQIPDVVYGWANGEKLVKFTLNELTLPEAQAM
ncbi:PTS lactose transporter subunit IIB [Lentilactobacillus senioris]|uniref:PTS sugar transporter subunit IIB n=1 Tax=Lentilactobacillus senioris TaxID=931534 RepID=UPI0022815603|nr:PTS lactose transporter subunit IIB [Lentilactobacillus senioris]MCY9807108.1 PTS lactose transporter subunit IIB [Lentilactobacillus senioris]